MDGRPCARRQFVGRPRQELLGLRVQDVTHPDDLGRNLPPFAALAEGRGGPFVIEKRCVRPDGAAVWVQNSVSAIRDNQGRAAAKRAAASESSHGARGWS